MAFPIIDVTAWPWYRDEQMGSKPKLWVLDARGQRWLFKERRHDHGEDWAEKLAAEFATLIGVPHATIELAIRAGSLGIISKDFVTSRAAIQLMHGNELLVKVDADYPVNAPNFKATQHTVDKVLSVLRQDFISLGVFNDRPPGITSPPEEFVGYLLLDAVVGNTDRHHENWAIIVKQTARAGVVEAELAPLYDTASCLGRECPDGDRTARLSGHPNAPKFEAYWRKMPSRWYRDPGDKKWLHPTAAFRLASQRFPAAAKIWLDRLERITDERIDGMIADVPPERITDPGRLFARKVLQSSLEHLRSP